MEVRELHNMSCSNEISARDLLNTIENNEDDQELERTVPGEIENRRREGTPDASGAYERYWVLLF